MRNLFRSYKNNPAFLIAALIAGAALAVGGSVLATSVGDSVSVTSVLTVSGRSQFDGSVGVGTTTPGTTFALNGTAHLNSSLVVGGTFTATSTTLLATAGGNVGIGTTSPSSLFAVQGVGNFFSAATSTLYTDLILSSLAATSTVYLANGTAALPSMTFTSDPNLGVFRAGADLLGFATAGSERARIDASGNLGVATTTPGTLLSVQGVANWQVGTSTIYSAPMVPNFAATSTATSTAEYGVSFARVGGSMGVATTTGTQALSVGGSGLFGKAGTTSVAVTSTSAGVGGCIQLQATDGTMIRIYATTSITSVESGTGSAAASGYKNLVVQTGVCKP